MIRSIKTPTGGQDQIHRTDLGLPDLVGASTDPDDSTDPGERCIGE